jgi:hypothetical protein
VVEIDPQIWTEWRERSETSMKAMIQMLYTSDQDPVADTRRVRSVVKRVVSAFDAIQESLPDGQDPVGAGAWSVNKTADGTLITAGNKCDAFEPLLTEIISRLDRNATAGSGHLELYFSPEPPRLPELTEHVQARLRVSGQPPEPDQSNRWFADNQAVRRVTKTVVRWCMTLRPDVAITVEQLHQPARTVTRAESAEVIMDDLITTATWPTLTVIAADRYRSVVVSGPDGRVTAIEGGQTINQDTGRGAITSLRQLMISVADDLIYGYIKGGSWLEEARLDTLGQRGNGPYPRLAHGHPASMHEDRFAPDAFAIQLLGPDYRDRVPASPDWNTTELSNGRTLVEHRTPEAWFAPLTIEQALTGKTQPPLHLLAQARHDLADLLYPDTLKAPRRGRATGRA